MTLQELSQQYQQQAEALDVRIRQLTDLEDKPLGRYERARVHRRLRLLRAMRQDTREVAAITRHYYDRRERF